MKCPKCGREFDGNFCPNCGTVVGEVTRCPVCGKERTNNERFCSGCGYAYEKPEQKKEIDAPVTLYKALHLAPLILFAAMAILAFLFSIAPAISGMGSVSAYGLLGDDSFDGMQRTAIFLLIAELLFLIAAAALAYFTYRFKSTDDKRFYTVLKANVATSAAYYLVLFVIGIVMCAQVGAYDDGWGLFSVGACPVLFIVFSLLFGIAEAASVILSTQLVKKYPQLKEVKIIAESSAAAGVSAGGAAVQGAGQAAAVKKERAPLTAQAKKKIAVFAVLLAIVIVAVIVIVIICNSLSNIFRIGKVSQINLGDSKSQVVEILGEPDEYTETTYSYYSDNYKKILKEINSFDEDDINDWDDLFAAAEQEAELYEELESLTYQRIDVTFSDGEVTAIYLDASCCDSKDSDKTLETVTVLSGSFTQYSTDTTTQITYEAEFTDGSYAKATATAKRGSSTIITKTSDNIEITWSDKWYSKYSDELSVQEANYGYYLEDGTLTVSLNDAALSELTSNDKKSITNIIISDSVTTIVASAFSGYESLTSVTIPDSVTSIGEKAFYDCTSLENLTIGSGVTSIGNLAFSDCTALTEVYFNATALDNLSYGNNVFSRAGKNSNGITFIIGSNVTKIPTGLFYQSGSYGSYSYVNVTNIIFEDNSLCTSIDDYTFRGCALTSIIIPDSVTSIGNYAFYNCTSLTSVTIGNGVTSIGDSAFYNCTSLTSVTIGNGVTSIGDSAFYKCTSLESINIPDGVTSVGNNAFRECTSLTNVTIGKGITIIGLDTFYNCTSLKNITLGSGVTSIGYGAFDGCSALTSIIIPDSVTSIGNYAFNGCSSLTSIIIPDRVTSIDDYAFRNCNSLNSVTFENTSGWYVTTSSFLKNGTELDVTNSSQNATYLKSTYVSYYWYRSED